MSNPLAEITTLQQVAPASLSAAAHSGTAIDWSATYESEATVVLTCGVLGASATAVAVLEESDTSGGSYDPVATTHTAVKATDDGLVFTASGKVTKRFARVTITVGTAASIVGAVVLAKPRTFTAA